MNIFDELKPNVEAFKSTRDHVISCAQLPPTDGALGCGQPPFAVDDGTNYYAVIDENSNVSPLPFGYQIPDENLEVDGFDAIYSTPIAAAGTGMNIARYIPLAESFELPGDRAFCLETAEDSEAWEAVGDFVESIQQALNERTLLIFNQRLSNAVIHLYAACDEIESVDQAISVLFLEPSILPTLFLRSYQHALDALQDEVSAEEDDDDEQ